MSSCLGCIQRTDVRLAQDIRLKTLLEVIVERPLERVEHLAPVFGSFLEQLGVANSLYWTAFDQKPDTDANAPNLQLLH
jgi:hypothetical protein